MKMNKKGQAAMEFLMTYGWAILVVLVAIGALAYFGVLDAGALLPQRTSFGPDIINEGNAFVQSNGTVTLSLKNSLGYTINITNITDVTAGTKDCATLTPPTLPMQMLNGESKLVTWSCGPQTGKKRMKSDVKLNYLNVETQVPGALTGSITARVQ